MEPIVCPVCQREMSREKIEDGGYRILVKGAQPAPCCMKAATDGFKVYGKFVTEP